MALLGSLITSPCVFLALLLAPVLKRYLAYVSWHCPNYELGNLHDVAYNIHSAIYRHTVT